MRDRGEALAWLAHRLAWEDRLCDLEPRADEPTPLTRGSDRRAGSALRRGDGGSALAARAS